MKLKSLLLSICLGILMLGIHSQANATHFMGVSVSYECMGACTYRIHHETYYDCSGGATAQLPGPPAVPFITFAGLACSQPVAVQQAWHLIYYLDITPVCPGTVTLCAGPSGGSPTPISGVLEARFYRDYNFCNVGIGCTNMAIGWSSCCRNGAITSGAANTGIYLSTSINLSQSPCNSSPRFSYHPSPHICAGRTTTVGQGAFDADGDSLSYSLVTCLTGTATPVTHNLGYSPLAPLGPTWNVSLDAVTGVLTFAPSPSGIQVVGIVCVQVEEWRNGVLLAETTRDLQVTVLACGPGDAPTIDSITSVTNATQLGGNTFETCIGNLVSITFEVSDPNIADSIFATSNIGVYFPGATVTTAGNNPIQATVTFQASTAGRFGFGMFYHDNHCPLPGYTTDAYTVVVNTVCISGLVTHTPCHVPNGAIDITVNNLTGPFTYLWSNGATTEDITGLLPGQYTVTVTDGSGNPYTKTFWVNGTSLNVSTVLTHPDCGGILGAIQTSVTGGGLPYTYLWNTGDTTANITGLSAGGYSLTVTDNYGCVHHIARILDLADSCFNIIEGHVFNDLNGNCVQDAGEPGLPYVYINLASGGAILTDATGYYKVRVGSGVSTLTVVPPTAYHTPACPTSGIHSVTFVGLKQTATLDYAMDVALVQDLKITMVAGRAGPGRSRRAYLIAENVGSITMNGSVNYMHDPSFTYLGTISASRPVGTTYNALTSTVSWSFSNLASGQRLSILVRTGVDSTAVLGTNWCDSANVLPIVGDSTPVNNTTHFCDTIRGPWDPNYKAVSPEGLGDSGYILASGDQMHYTVHFQNLGTDTAFYVVVRDTIDPDLEISTFRPGAESFPYSLVVEDDSILVFTFSHINLPASRTDFEESQGHLSYYLRHNGTLAAGTKIQNSAAIYFDFNKPVITNTVSNTIYTQPAVSLGNDTTICEGEPVLGNITAPGMPPYDFAWSTGQNDPGNTSGQSQTAVSNSGLYSVTVTDAFGFTATSIVDVTAMAASDATFSFTRNSLTYNFVSSAMSNTTWSWDFGDGNTAAGSATVTHTYAAKGVYTVTLVAANDCGSDGSSHIVDFSTAIEDDVFAQAVRIQPNPFTSSTLVSFENTSLKPALVKLYDLSGKVLRQYSTKSDQVEIKRESLSQGIYLLEIRAEAGVYYGRLVVE